MRNYFHFDLKREIKRPFWNVQLYSVRKAAQHTPNNEDQNYYSYLFSRHCLLCVLYKMGPGGKKHTCHNVIQYSIFHSKKKKRCVGRQLYKQAFFLVFSNFQIFDLVNIRFFFLMSKFLDLPNSKLTPCPLPPQIPSDYWHIQKAPLESLLLELVLYGNHKTALPVQPDDTGGKESLSYLRKYLLSKEM